MIVHHEPSPSHPVALLQELDQERTIHKTGDNREVHIITRSNTKTYRMTDTKVEFTDTHCLSSNILS